MIASKTPSTEEALEYAIDAIESGKVKLGYDALGWVLQREPENRVAWLWMACTQLDEDAKRACYSRIGSQD